MGINEKFIEQALKRLDHASRMLDKRFSKRKYKTKVTGNDYKKGQDEGRLREL